MSKRNPLAHKASLDRRRSNETESASRTVEHQEVAALAYALWQRRGCPVGSPEIDWTEAEAALQHLQEPQLQV